MLIKMKVPTFSPICFCVMALGLVVRYTIVHLLLTGMVYCELRKNKTPTFHWWQMYNEVETKMKLFSETSSPIPF